MTTLTNNFKTHRYDQIGVFHVMASADNSVGAMLATVPEPIIVQHPVTGFIIECGMLSLVRLRFNVSHGLHH